MTINKIRKEIQLRIEYLQEKKKKLIIIDGLDPEKRHEKEEEYNDEIDKLSKMLHHDR